MTFSLTVLGSSGMFGTIHRACAGYLVESDEARLLIDCGSGTWRNLLDQIDHASLDGIFLSHRHPDHVSDLFQVFHARRYGSSEPMAKIPLWAPAETLDRITSFTKELDEAFTLNAVAPGDALETGGVAFTFFEMAHPPETVGIRMERGGESIAYSSDTGPHADLTALARNATVFVCEATLQDSDQGWEGHLRAAQAGEAAAEAGAKKLVLTHLPPGRDHGLSLTEAHKTSGDAEVQLASDGLKVEVAR